jgi:hypothetical protein
MGEQIRRYNKRQETLKRLREFDEKSSLVLVIHYSCESFYDRTDGSTPRITSIAVRNLASGQTESFSIHKEAELKSIPVGSIAEHYDPLEKKMLSEFFEFLRSHLGFTWVHWNMRDINYGFQAIEHRFKVLGGDPRVSLPEERKFDLARALVSIYGLKYVGHPRLESIVKLNHVTDRDFLNGEQESVAFVNGEYVKLHLSTLRKVDILANLFERTLQRSLKTKAGWLESHGLHPKLITELISEHWVWAAILILMAIIGLLSSFITIKDHFAPRPNQPVQSQAVKPSP